MEENIWESDKVLNVSSPSSLGRVINTLLSSNHRHLEAAISRISSNSQRSSRVLLDESLVFIRTYVKDAAEKREHLDQILVPMIENSLKSKGSKQCKQVIILLRWLFQDELLFQALSSNLAEVITRKEDNYISLGWCTLMCSFVDAKLTMDQHYDIGKQEKHKTLLKILCPSISHLSSIICHGSTVQDGYELPTRLAVAAADCTLVFTEALTRRTAISQGTGPTGRPQSSNTSAANRQVMWEHIACSEREGNLSSSFPGGSDNMEMEFLLWDHLDELTILVQKLEGWNKKSRPLHAKGLEQVFKWLQEIRGHYSSLQDETAGKMLKTGVLLLSSCWKHYGMLLRLDNHNFSQHYLEMLDQYMSAIEFCTQDDTDELLGKKSGGIETRKFFLNCIALLWGRLDNKQLETATSESGLQILKILLSQLQCADEDVIEGAVSILRVIIFKANCSSTGSNFIDNHQMEAILPSLLNLLDERDSAARAVVLLVAEYCSMNPNAQCLQDVFKRLSFGNHCQRKNAIDVISELIRLSSDSGTILPPSLRQDIATKLLECLVDEELVIRIQASNLLPHIDPALVLPELVGLVYSQDERVQSCASDAVVELLKCHSQNFDAIDMLLDCLSNLNQCSDQPKTAAQIGGRLPSATMTLQSGSKLDVDRVLKLLPKWAKSVQDWSILIKLLIEKMFSDPSNATIVRFLSYISEHLAAAGDIILQHVLSHMQGQQEVGENLFSKLGDGTFTSDDSVKLKNSLFDRLCPLLIIRLLPLRFFNDLSSSTMYGELPNQEILHDNREFSVGNHGCVASILVNRAFHLFEFEDVRKLAAELCGRLHPQVLLPIIGSHLEHSTHNRDILKMKACLFALCTSLAIRGRDSALHPVMVKIRKLLEKVLLWPSLDADEVSKAQHGCIDCLAMMICAELQAPDASQDFTWDKIEKLGEEKSHPEDAAVMSSVLTYVIQRLVCDENKVPLAKLDCPSEAISLSFRLCMANVLISACQKTSASYKHLFAQRTLPYLILHIEDITCSEVRAACLQVLFSTVYHLKASILPYSSSLLRLSVKALRKGSDKEKIASAKLMVSLMASEDVVVDSISMGLLEAKSVLASITLTDSSLELRQLCEKLLACLG